MKTAATYLVLLTCATSVMAQAQKEQYKKIGPALICGAKKSQEGTGFSNGQWSTQVKKIEDFGCAYLDRKSFPIYYETGRLVDSEEKKLKEVRVPVESEEVQNGFLKTRDFGLVRVVSGANGNVSFQMKETDSKRLREYVRQKSSRGPG